MAVSYTHLIYAQPVHYLENGEWKDSDNSLQYEGKAFEDAAGYTNAANDFQVRFAEHTLQNEFISVQQGEYKLDWKYVGATDEMCIRDSILMFAVLCFGMYRKIGDFGIAEYNAFDGVRHQGVFLSLIHI